MNDSQAFEFGLSICKNCILCKRRKMQPKIQSILVYVELLLGGSRSSLVSHGQFANDNFCDTTCISCPFCGQTLHILGFFLGSNINRQVTGMVGLFLVKSFEVFSLSLHFHLPMLKHLIFYGCFMCAISFHEKPLNGLPKIRSLVNESVHLHAQMQTLGLKASVHYAWSLQNIV